MKKTITTLALALSLFGVAISQSRSGQMASKPSPDAKLISKTVEGSEEVCRWLVMDTNDDGTNDFTVHYQMNLTKLVSTYERNSQELQSLHKFLDSLAKSDHKQIKQINIVGFASPDGPATLNQKLANARAADFRAYVNTHYSLSDVAGKTYGVALTWGDAKSAIAASSVPSRTEVVDLVGSSHAASAIEEKLKAMTPSWNYLCEYVLPKMRYVDMRVTYNSWREVVTRTPISTSSSGGKRASAKSNDELYFIIVEDDPSGIMLFENDYAPLDFDEDYTERYKYKSSNEKYKERSSNRRYRSKVTYR